jgi:hypothetical protein
MLSSSHNLSAAIADGAVLQTLNSSSRPVRGDESLGDDLRKRSLSEGSGRGAAARIRSRGRASSEALVMRSRRRNWLTAIKASAKGEAGGHA